MKGNRRARSLERFGEDDRGASEMVGYMIAFALGSMILVLSLTAFNTMRDHSGEMVADRAVSEMAHRVAFAVEESLSSGADFPDSDFSRTLRLPAEVSGHTFTIELGRANIWVNLTNAAPAVKDEKGNDLETLGRTNVTFTPRANAEVLCSGGRTELPGAATCRVHSNDGEVTIRFAAPDPAKPNEKGVFMVRD